MLSLWSLQGIDSIANFYHWYLSIPSLFLSYIHFPTEEQIPLKWKHWDALFYMEQGDEDGGGFCSSLTFWFSLG